MSGFIAVRSPDENNEPILLGICLQNLKLKQCHTKYFFSKCAHHNRFRGRFFALNFASVLIKCSDAQDSAPAVGS